jgi:hypothetical protein
MAILQTRPDLPVVDLFSLLASLLVRLGLLVAALLSLKVVQPTHLDLLVVEVLFSSRAIR